MNFVVRAGDGRTGITQFLNHRVQRAWCRVGHAYIATGGGDGSEESAGLDTVWHHGMLSFMQRSNALDGNHIAAMTGNICAHFDQTLGEIHDLGLARGVFEDGGAIGKGCGHHQIFGTGDGDDVHENMRAF